MGMWKSPHRKARGLKPTGDVWLPAGKKGGKSAKADGGNEPGKTFRDPKGRIHTVPDRRRRKRFDKTRPA